MNTRGVQRAGEHRYYIVASAGIIAVVLAGFSIDVPLLSHLGSMSMLVRAHGLIMLAWIALFFVQTLLVARHRIDLHMRLGVFGAVLAALVVVASTATLITACRLGEGHMPPGISKPLFLAFGLVDLSVFTVLIGTALALRKRASDWHKRLMLLAVILLLDAALARFIGVYTTWTVDASVVRNLLMLACVAVDTIRHRRLHPAFAAGGLLAFSTYYVGTWIAATPTWLDFVQRLLA